MLKVFGEVLEGVRVLAADSSDLGGEWKAEISVDLLEVVSRLEGIVEDLDMVLAEAVSVRERMEEDEAAVVERG
ncbi:MAG: hypothetical protein PVH79_02525 [Candidatus Bathyarchaeota archaeon]